MIGLMIRNAMMVILYQSGEFPRKFWRSACAVVWALLDDTGARELMIVGHDPDFSALLTYLIDAAGMGMKKGALATVDLHTKLGDGEGVLRWLVPPDLLAES